MMGQVYGETNPKCADTLFSYGKALLEHAIQQSSVLGGATEKKSEKELEAVVAAATGIIPGGSSSSSAPAPSNPRFVFEGDDDDEEEEEDEEAEEGGASSGAAADGEGGEEEQDDFAVAWDVLDLARVLYHRQETEEALLKLGDVHIALGDVSLESENFEQAVTDYREALKIKEARLEPEDRELAEAHYKLALALEYSPTESEKTQDHIHRASTVLKARIEKLNGILASYGKGKGKALDASESENKLAKELVELHELVGEMDQKVQDLISNMANKKPEEGQAHIAVLTEMLGQKQAQAVNDISNLIVKSKASSASGAGSSSSPASAVTPKQHEEADTGLKRKAEESADAQGDSKSEEEADKKVKV
ncbi:hypothetical protein BGZ83_010222 [Gryganskiella cystojenkinii]|nr:hypothetical protein BGZ83_010222 [Gryganskiella cystojenkinii]